MDKRTKATLIPVIESIAKDIETYGHLFYGPRFYGVSRLQLALKKRKEFIYFAVDGHGTRLEADIYIHDRSQETLTEMAVTLATISENFKEVTLY